MANEFMWAVTESVHHLANQTAATAGQIAGTTSNLNGTLESVVTPNWIGPGSNTWAAGQGTWTDHASRFVIHPLDSKSMDMRSSANLMDHTDMDVGQTMGAVGSGGSVGSVINPVTA